MRTLFIIVCFNGLLHKIFHKTVKIITAEIILENGILFCGKVICFFNGTVLFSVEIIVGVKPYFILFLGIIRLK